MGRRVNVTAVHFEVTLEAIPDVPRQRSTATPRVRSRSPTCEHHSRASPFWSSMKESLLQVDVKGWRLVYRILPDRREIRVIELEPSADEKCRGWPEQAGARSGSE